MASQKPIEKILAGWQGFERPADRQKFRHYKGGLYEIVATGFLEESEEPCVIYRSLKKNIIWVRTAKNFLEEVEYNGVKQSRFARID